MSTSSNTTFEFDVNHNGEFKLNPLTYQHGSLLNIHVLQMDFEDMVSYLKWKIPRQFTTLYYMLPPNYALSGMKQIKNDYETNVMYDIAKVAGKLQIFVSHTPIDLSTVLIPNNGSLEESLAGIIRQETQNDYTFNKMVEWAEQEHFEYEETKTSHTISPISTMLSSTIESCLSYTHFFSPLTYYMAYGANEARQAIVLKLQREIQAEETLADQLLCNLTRYTEEMRIRSVQITMLQSMPTTSLNTYGLHALLMTHEADIRTTNIILRTRQQLLRSISAKQNFVNNYMAI
ncbi:hypothetical protein Tco_0828532 [Tanacetum coccineum]